MSDTNQIIQALVDFRNQVDREPFYKPKDLALATSIEANKLLKPSCGKLTTRQTRQRGKKSWLMSLPMPS